MTSIASAVKQTDHGQGRRVRRPRHKNGRLVYHTELYKACNRPAPGKFKNCSCDNEGQCLVHKDRGWFLDRLNERTGNYTGSMEK